MLTRQPKRGDRVAWRMDGKLKHHATALRIEGNLCWCEFADGTRDPFIWRFHDGTLNILAELVGEPAYNKAPEDIHA